MAKEKNTTIDLNDAVKVILTDYGANILNEQNTEMKNHAPSINWKVDYKQGEEYKTTLWSLICDFGHACAAGGEKVFIHLEKI